MWKEIPEWNWYLVNEQGQVLNTKINKIIVGDVNNIGYHRVTLSNNNNRKRLFIHRLVAELFLDNPNNLKEVNHIDGNKSNNNITNLEWCDRTHNEHEARRICIKAYKPFQVIFADGRVEEYEFTPQLANELGVTRRTVLNYLQGKSKGYIDKGITKIQYL